MRIPFGFHLAAEWLWEDPRLARLADQVIELGMGSAQQAAAAAAAVSLAAWCIAPSACKQGGSCCRAKASMRLLPAGTQLLTCNGVPLQRMPQSTAALKASVSPAELHIQPDCRRPCRIPKQPPSRRWMERAASWPPLRATTLLLAEMPLRWMQRSTLLIHPSGVGEATVYAVLTHAHASFCAAALPCTACECWIWTMDDLPPYRLTASSPSPLRRRHALADVVLSKLTHLGSQHKLGAAGVAAAEAGAGLAAEL